jgi:hypothetical protein
MEYKDFDQALIWFKRVWPPLRLNLKQQASKILNKLDSLKRQEVIVLLFDRMIEDFDALMVLINSGKLSQSMLLSRPIMECHLQLKYLCKYPDASLDYALFESLETIRNYVDSVKVHEDRLNGGFISPFNESTIADFKDRIASKSELEKHYREKGVSRLKRKGEHNKKCSSWYENHALSIGFEVRNLEQLARFVDEEDPYKVLYNPLSMSSHGKGVISDARPEYKDDVFSWGDISGYKNASWNMLELDIGIVLISSLYIVYKFNSDELDSFYKTILDQSQGGQIGAALPEYHRNLSRVVFFNS